MNYLNKNILQQPQLASASFFETICEVVNNKTLRQEMAAAQSNGFKSNNLFVENLKSVGVGVLEIDGVLTAKPTAFKALCGGCDYQSLIADMQQLAKDGFKQICMVISSGGGEAYNCFYTSSQLRKIADANNIKLTAYVDNSACSAAYALACAAHEIVCDKESASVGSIGVVIQLTNDSEALKQAGYKRTYIFAGNSKIPFNADGEFKEEFLNDLQDSVNSTYEKFVEHVATYRPLSKQQIIDTQAKVFNADKALALKLVDKLSTHTEFIESFKTTSIFKTTPATQTKATIDTAHMARIKAALDKTEQPQLTAEDHKQKLQNSVKWFYENRMKDK
ncbi:S49 family peptidase [Vibrio diazotrophicus]|uniref:S49 family peptidase n=1 Tax=Vibrio diazotrophicus TaxID=685 RepID=UPI00142E23AB|nr:S49 family peptidase [Vibrio diazotrophicus]NIY94578.1 hypothetical protein [Vibrio diazotrophicus]